MKTKKLLLPIAAGLGIALFSKKTNGASKKSVVDKGFVFKCNPVEFYFTDKNRAFDYINDLTVSLIKKYPDPDTINFNTYLKDYLSRISPQCYKLYVSDKLSRKGLMVTALLLEAGLKAYLRESFGAEYVTAYLSDGEGFEFTEEEEQFYKNYVIYFENYVEPQWLKIASSFNFTKEELEKMNEIELTGKLD